MAKNFEKRVEYLESLDTDKLIDLWNSYCESNYTNDEQILPNSEDTITTLIGEGTSVFDALRMAEESWKSSDDFVTLRAGDLVSMRRSQIDDYIDCDAMAKSDSVIDGDEFKTWLLSEEGYDDFELPEEAYDIFDEFDPDSDDWDETFKKINAYL